MERAMLSIHLKAKIKISVIKNKFKANTNRLFHVKKLKWDWTGHVCRLNDQRWTQKITFYQIRGGQRPGKQKGRWTDNMTKFIKNKLFHRIAANRVEWARLREGFTRRETIY